MNNAIAYTAPDGAPVFYIGGVTLEPRAGEKLPRRVAWMPVLAMRAGQSPEVEMMRLV
jgi:hypothetical protein